MSVPHCIDVHYHFIPQPYVEGLNAHGIHGSTGVKLPNENPALFPGSEYPIDIARAYVRLVLHDGFLRFPPHPLRPRRQRRTPTVHGPASFSGPLHRWRQASLGTYRQESPLQTQRRSHSGAERRLRLDRDERSCSASRFGAAGPSRADSFRRQLSVWRGPDLVARTWAVF